MSGKPTQIDTPRSLWRRIVRINSLLILATFALCVYIIVELLDDPLSRFRIMTYLPLLFASSILVNRLFYELRRYWLRPASKLIRVLISIMGIVITIGGPLLLVAIVDHGVNSREQTLVAQHFLPTISKIEQYRRQYGRPPQMLQPEQSADAALSFTYFYGKDAYLIETAGGSIDMDGSTIYYLSTLGHWQRMHNDLLTSPQPSAVAKRLLSLEKQMTAVRYHF